jgi:hypothetical protein
VETGAEREKRLRKLAQRGVVRLFNAIGAAQGAPDKAAREEKKRQKELASQGGSVATTTVAELMEGAGTTKLRRPNILGGRGRAEGCEYPLFRRRRRVGTDRDRVRSVESVGSVVPRLDPCSYEPTPRSRCHQVVGLSLQSTYSHCSLSWSTRRWTTRLKK